MKSAHTGFERKLIWVRDHYGSLRGLRRHVASTLIYRIAPVAREVQWAQVSRLVYVCKGNICRSPFAEALSIQSGFDSISFGLDAKPGTPANELAVEVARTLGVDLIHHKSRLWNPTELDHRDLVLCMEPAHAKVIKREVKERGGQITLLGLYNDSPRPYIHDPYAAGPAYFRRCFTRIREAVDTIIRNCESRHA